MRVQKRKMVGALLALAMLVTSLVPQTTVEAATTPADAPDPVVVVLDPGHGGKDGGATRKWSGKSYIEKNANLAIALACKQALEQYAGVKVYLTRSSDRYVSLNARVNYAKKKNADLFVSLHNNSSLSSSFRGACVYYPNSSYNKQLGTEGKAAARCIQKKLAALGLKNLGIHTRNSETNTRYPDSSKADYYSVIRQSKLAGFPGLIVEHAYVSNASDCKGFLGSAAKLKKLGKADAQGIAAYFGLVKKETQTLTKASAGDSGIQLAWKKTKVMSGYRIYRRVAGQKKYVLLKKIKKSSTTSYTDTEAEPGVTYQYAIAAYHTGKTKVAYTKLSAAKKVTALPATPSNFAVGQMEDGTAKLTFDALTNADGYLLERRVKGETEFQQIADIAQTENPEYLDTGVTEGTEYEYRLCAYVKVGKKIIAGAKTSVLQFASNPAETEPVQNAQNDDELSSPEIGINDVE